MAAARRALQEVIDGEKNQMKRLLLPAVWLVASEVDLRRAVVAAAPQRRVGRLVQIASWQVRGLPPFTYLPPWLSIMDQQRIV